MTGTVDTEFEAKARAMATPGYSETELDVKKTSKHGVSAKLVIFN